MAALDASGLTPLDTVGLTELTDVTRGDKAFDTSGLKSLDVSGLQEYSPPLTDYPIELGKSAAEGAKNFFASAAKGIAADLNEAPGKFRRGLLEQIDRIDRGEKLPELEDTLGYQHMAPEQRRAMRVDVERDAAVPSQPVTQNPLFKAGEAIEDFGKETLGPRPGFEGRTWTRDIGSGFGSVGAGILTSMVSPRAAMLMWVAAGSGEAAERAVKAGATPEQIELAAKLGAGPGATDALDGLLPMLGSTGKALGFIKRVGLAAVIGAITEGGQEGLQQFLQNAIAKGIYKPDQDLTEDVARNIAVGMIVGGTTAGGFSAAGRDHGAGTGQQPYTPAVPAGAVSADTIIPAPVSAPQNVSTPDPLNGPAIAAGSPPVSPAVAVPDVGPAPISAQPPVATPAGVDPAAVEPGAPAPPTIISSPTNEGANLIVGEPAGRAILQKLFDDPRSADDIRTAMAAADAWQPSADWQVMPQGARLDPTLEIKQQGKQTLARIPPTPGTRAAPVQLEAAPDVHAGAERTADPTPAQAKAGNYAKRHVTWNGLDIAIETEAGQARTGISADGTPWSTTLSHPYGYIKRTVGKDGDQVDVYLGNDPGSPRVFVFDQVDPDSRAFDEHKLVIGARDRAEAQSIYEAGFSDGSAQHRWATVTEMSVPELKSWLASGDTKKPLNYSPPKQARAPRNGARAPLSLFQFLASKGGIRDHGGELTAVGLDKRFVPGHGRLVRSTGMPLDRAREAALEAGYLTDAPALEAAASGGMQSRPTESTIVDLLDALHREAHGERQYSAADHRAAADRQERAATKEHTARARQVEADVRDLAQRIKVARLTDEEVRQAVELVMVSNADVDEALAEVIERSAYAVDDDLVASLPLEGVENGAPNAAAATRENGADPASPRQHPEGPQPAAETGSAPRGEQPAGAQHAGRDEAGSGERGEPAGGERTGVAPPSTVHDASNPQSVQPQGGVSADAASIKPAPTDEELEIPAFLRRVKDEPRAAPATSEPAAPSTERPVLSTEQANNSTEQPTLKTDTPTGRMSETDIKLEGDRRWRNWMPGKENRADGAHRPRRQTFIKQVRKEVRQAEREETRARAIEEKQRAKAAEKQARADARRATADASARDVSANTDELINKGSPAAEPTLRSRELIKNRKQHEAAPLAIPDEVFALRRDEPTPTPPTAPTFYSAVARAIQTVKLAKAPAIQWLNTIRNAPGVKAEELEWLGLADWLKEQTGAVTRDAISDYVRANQIEVREVEKGRSGMSQADFDRLMQLGDYVRQSGALLEGQDVADYARLSNMAAEQGYPGENTKFSSYTLPGGENYRELLLTLPTKPQTGKPVFHVEERGKKNWSVVNSAGEMVTTYGSEAYANSVAQDWNRDGLPAHLRGREGSGDYRSSHWDEPNVVSHIRFNDRTIDGKRTLFIEEVQSDWHQAGKRKGYKQDTPVEQVHAARDAATEARRTLGETMFAIEKKSKATLTAQEFNRIVWAIEGANDLSVIDDIVARDKRFDVPEFHQAALGYNDAYRKHMALFHERIGVPDAPFKTTWPELSMKRMIRYAAENGYASVAWTTGATQNERYDLSKQVEKIEAIKFADGTYRLDAVDRNGASHVLANEISAEKMADYVGKDMAERIANDPRQKPNAVIGYSGVDLKVGGEGMVGFYDKILPATVNKLTKKFGGKVESRPLNSEKQTFEDFSVPGAPAGWAVAETSTQRPAPAGSTAHTLDITPALRDAVLGEGFPLFKRSETAPKGWDRADTDTGEPPSTSFPPNTTVRTFTGKFDEQARALYADLRTRLDHLGLKDVGLRLVDRIEHWSTMRISTPDAMYARELITLGLDATENPAAQNLEHEALHGLRRLGFFTDGEWSILERASNARWRKQFDVDRVYSAWPEATKVEEGIAWAYAEWAAGKAVPGADGRVVRMFKRIRNFFEALGNALRGHGFKSAADIFASIDSGAVGRRQPRDQKTGRFATEGAIAYAVRSGDGDLFKTEIVNTPDGPREQGVIPGAEQISQREQLERRGNEPKRSPKVQKSTEELPLFREPDKQDEMFALRREPETATDRTNAMQGFLARGQFIDRAIRMPFDWFGGITKDGQWKPGQNLWTKDSGLLMGALIGARVGAAVSNPIGAAAGHVTGRLIGGKLGAQFGEGAAAIVGGLPGAAAGAIIGGAAGKLVNAQFSPNGRLSFLNPMLETVRAGLLDRYGLDPAYVERERGRTLDERAVMLQGAEVIRSLKDHAVGPQEARVLQAILTGENVKDADMTKLAEPIRQAIDALGEEAVALGLVSRESFERNRGAYLHRVYMKNEAEQNGVVRMVGNIMGSRRKKLIGNQLKGRGLFQEVEVERLMRDSKGYNSADDAIPQKGEKFILLDQEQQQQSAAPGREGRIVTRRVYWPAGEAIPDRYANFTNRGTWEVRGAKGGKLTIWRDFSKAERTQMGEILDARYTIGKTFMLMAHDLSVGKFYKDIAENEEWSSTKPPAGEWIEASEWQAQWRRVVKRSDNVEWVRVPDAELPGTGGKKRWGALSGQWVREEIWRDLNELNAMNSPNGFSSYWRPLLTQWKLNKTARSPVVHTNNVMSNFLLMDMMDVRMQDLAGGIRSFVSGDAHYQEAMAHGAFGADAMSQEVRDQVLKPLLEEMQRANTFQQGGNLGTLGQASKFTEMLWSKLKLLDQKMIDAYRVEDEVFRMAAYIRRRELGDDAKQAADVAREQFIDYDIRAPWVNMARNSVLPFISYTYRAAPIIAKAVATRPWKLAKYVTLGFALNAIAYALTGGDEDKERRSLRERESGRTWIGVPKMLRMPLNDRYGNPIFLDINRWMPGGDIFDTNGSDWPSWLGLGGPMMIGFELYMNRNAFLGQDIWNPKIDNFGDRIQKRADHLYKSWMPSAAWVPGSWYWESVGNAMKGATDRQGRPNSVPLALSQSVGVKLKPQDVQDALTAKGQEFMRIEKELEAEAYRMASRKQRKIISEAEFNKAMNSIIEKQKTVAEKARETLK